MIMVIFTMIIIIFIVSLMDTIGNESNSVSTFSWKVDLPLFQHCHSYHNIYCDHRHHQNHINHNQDHIHHDDQDIQQDQMMQEAKNLPVPKGTTLPDPYCKW